MHLQLFHPDMTPNGPPMPSAEQLLRELRLIEARKKTIKKLLPLAKNTQEIERLCKDLVVGPNRIH